MLDMIESMLHDDEVDRYTSILFDKVSDVKLTPAWTCCDGFTHTPNRATRYLTASQPKAERPRMTRCARPCEGPSNPDRARHPVNQMRPSFAGETFSPGRAEATELARGALPRACLGGLWWWGEPRCLALNRHGFSAALMRVAALG